MLGVIAAVLAKKYVKEFPVCELFMVAMAGLSVWRTPKAIREANRFAWGPIIEVAVKNAPFSSASDLLSVPFSQYTHQMQNVPLATSGILATPDTFLFSMQDVNRLNFIPSTSTSDIVTQHDISQRGQGDDTGERDSTEHIRNLRSKGLDGGSSVGVGPPSLKSSFGEAGFYLTKSISR